MSKALSIKALDIPQLTKFGIGFDSMFDELMRVSQSQHNSNYPPYNLIRTGDNTFIIELAVSGFQEGEISITVDKSLLTISGSKSDTEVVNYEYVHKGISSRNFKQTFTLAEHVEINDANVKNGILSVYLERVVPEDKKPRLIDVKFN